MCALGAPAGGTSGRSTRALDAAVVAALPTSKAELLAALRALAQRTPRTRDDLRQLQEDSLALALHIQRNMALHNVPHSVWHFLHDADIRFKDAAYAEMQLSQISEVLGECEYESGI